MIFARLVVWAGNYLPKEWKLTWHLRLLLDYDGCKKRLIEWHRAELETLDTNFCLQQAGLKLVAARERARAEGINPLSAAYPDIFDFLPPGELHVNTKFDLERITREKTN